MKHCTHCNNRILKDGDGDHYCAECGRSEWYKTDGITRRQIEAYLRKSGWKCVCADTAAPPIHTAEIWVKAGYEYRLCFKWLRKLRDAEDLLVEDEQIWRAINFIADSEGISYALAASKIREVDSK